MRKAKSVASRPGAKTDALPQSGRTRHSIDRVTSANMAGLSLLIQLRGSWDGLRAEDRLRTAQCQVLSQDRIQMSKGYQERRKKPGEST